MAEHQIIANLPVVEIINRDAEFKIYSGDNLLGTLYISRGSLAWRPSGYATENPFHISWERFNDLMREEEGKRH